MAEEVNVRFKLVPEGNEVSAELENLKNKGKQLTEEEKKRIPVLKEQLKAYEMQEAALKKVNSQTQQVGVSIARIVQDAPFGIMGIGNNITFLSEQLANIQNNAKMAGQSISAFSILSQGVSQLFTSPVGLISVFVTLATVLSKTFEPAIEAAGKALTKFSDSIGLTDSKFSKFIEGYKERVKELIKINGKTPIPFAPKSAEEIEKEIKRYQEAILLADKQINEINRQNAVSPMFTFLEYLIPREVTKEIRQRREQLATELKALEDALTEFRVKQRQQLTLSAADVNVGLPGQMVGGRLVSKVSEQAIKAPAVSLAGVISRMQVLRPEFAPSNVLMGLTITQLEEAIQRVTKEIKDKGDITLVPRLRELKRVLNQKMIEAGLLESKEKSLLDPSFSPSQILVSDAAIQKQVEEDLKRERIRLEKLITGRAKLYTQTTYQMRDTAISSQSIEFTRGIGSIIGTGLGDMLAMSLSKQEEFIKRERELNLERLRLSRIDNERYEQEQLRSLRRREMDIENSLMRQQITDTEALARKKEIENEKMRVAEERAIRAKEIALQEESLRRSETSSIARATLANSLNYAVQFVFNALLNDRILIALGLPGVLLAAVLVPAALAAITALVRGSIASYASGGVVKSPTLAVVGDAKASGNVSNDEVIFNERLLRKQAERFAQMSSINIVLNGRSMVQELRRTERLTNVVRIR